MINHFEYDSTKCKGVLIKRKPKIEESYEDPITNMIVDKKSKPYYIVNMKKHSPEIMPFSVEYDKTVKIIDLT